MTRRFPPAHLIQGVPGRKMFHAVYNKGVGKEEVEPVAAQLSALRGVQARVIRGRLDGPQDVQVTVVEVTLSPAADVLQAMNLLKRLTRPQLPVALRLIRIGVLVCSCRHVSTTLDTVEFYPGLGPPDMAAFWREYAGAMRTLPVGRLLSAEPRPPYRLLLDGVEAVLDGLGARATALQVLPRRDTRACTH